MLLQTWRCNTTVGTRVALCRQPSCPRASVYFCSFRSACEGEEGKGRRQSSQQQQQQVHSLKKKMGWLSACLGGGHTTKQQRHCSKTFVPHHSSRGRLSSLPNHLKLPQAAREGHQSVDHTLKKIAAPPPTSSTCRDLRKVDVSRQRKSTSSTMLNIRIEGEIDTEISLQSDVHEMKEELATLRQILAVEADQTRKLKEEVNFLRSCGVLQKDFERKGLESEDLASPDDGHSFSGHSDEGHNHRLKKHQREGGSSVKQLYKCYSGPLNWNTSSIKSSSLPKCSPVLSAAAAEKIAKCMQMEHARLSAQRASLTPKLQFCHQKVHDCQDDRGMLNHGSEEGDADLHGRPVPQASTINGSQINLTEPDSKPQLVSWAHNVNFGAKPVGDMQNAGAQQGEHQVEDLKTLKGESNAEALEVVQWIEVRASPISSSSSSNVKDKTKFPGKSSAPMRANDVTKRSQRAARRQQKRSGARAENWPGDHNFAVTSSSHVGIADYPGSQLTMGALAKFKQAQQQLIPGHYSLTGNNTFRTSRKRHLGLWLRGFQTPLSPVRECLSVEEKSCSRESGNSEASAACDSGHVQSHQRNCHALDAANSVDKNHHSFESHTGYDGDVTPVNGTGDQEIECCVGKKNGDLNSLEKEPHLFLDSIDLEPIQCASPTLSQKRAASMGIGSVCTLAVSSPLFPDSQEFDRMEVGDSVDWDETCGSDEDASIDMQLIECSSPSFSPKKKKTPITATRLSVKGEFHSVVDSAEDAGGKDHMVAVESSSEGSFTGNILTWNPSPKENDQNWYSDAIEALQNMNDVQISSELCMSSFEEKSPAMKQRKQERLDDDDARSSSHGNSSESEALKRAFFWCESETDVHKNVGRYEEEVTQNEDYSEELYQMGEKSQLQSSLVMNGIQHRRLVLKSCTNSKRESLRGDGKFTETNEYCIEPKDLSRISHVVDKENIIYKELS